MPKHWWDEEDKNDERFDPPAFNAEDGIAPDEDIPYAKLPPVWRRIRPLHYVLAGLVLLLGFGGWLWFEVGKGLPTLDQLENPRPELATRLISADGELLDQYYIKNRTTVKLKNVPKDLVDALLATEDRDFYHHWGINLWGNLRAAWADIVTLSPRQGASTITQQLARNLYLTQQKSAMRKLREIVSAVQIERTHTKNEILEMYLNVAYFGRGAYGIEAASQVYFGVDVDKLKPAQSAYLVGILKGPENYDPDDDYDHALARRNTVIENMVEAKYITRDRADALKKLPIKVIEQQGYKGIAPHFAEMIRQELSKKPELNGYDLYRDGLVVYTTLNATMQRAANRAVEEHFATFQKTAVDKRWNWASHTALLDTIVAKAIRNDPDYRLATDDKDRRSIEHDLRNDKEFMDSVKAAEIRIQCGFVCLDQQTGGILAMVGSSNSTNTRYGLNHVTQIVRQPGSTFKPIVYSACFENGYTPETMVSNEPISIPDGDHVWSPGNFEGEASGGMRSIRSALQWSINLCAIHAMLELTTTQDVIKMAKRLGIRSNIPAYPSIAIGSAEVNPLELASAYSTFANEGNRAIPYAITSVEDHNGKVLYRARPHVENVMDAKIAHMVTSALIDVVEHGTGNKIRQLGFKYPAAGKTGTTQNYADAWFMGYTPQFTAGVWVGFDDKRITFNGSDGQGASAAAPIWGRFMKYSYEALKPKITYFKTDYSPSTKGNSVADSLHRSDSNYIPPINPIPNEPPMKPSGTQLPSVHAPGRLPDRH